MQHIGTKGIIKYFSFDILNQRDTKILLHRSVGSFKTFAKLVKTQDRER